MSQTVGTEVLLVEMHVAAASTQTASSTTGWHPLAVVLVHLVQQSHRPAYHAADSVAPRTPLQWSSRTCPIQDLAAWTKRQSRWTLLLHQCPISPRSFCPIAASAAPSISRCSACARVCWLRSSAGYARSADRKSVV